MKKLFIAFILMTGLNLYSHAQSTPAQTTPPSKAKKPATTATAPKTAATTTAPKTGTATATPKPATTAGPTKKDGSADMRYKSNKEAAKAPPATTHTKKDGTPDKRYKENKK
ncbi:MAG TPA: hypothetical protein VHQ04_03925 [Puia sp.]|nr:hypothetical protein [Puia sp.]